MNEQKPLVSVVVATLDRSDLLRRCLESLFDQDYRPVEVIVVDNGSSEDIKSFLSREFPSARCIRLEENRGFAGGYNEGIAAAAGKYVAVINNDAVAAREWLSSMVDAARRGEPVGMVVSPIVDGNQPGTLDSCGEGVSLDGMARQMMRGTPLEGFVPPGEVLLPPACACMYRKETLDAVGPYDEDFFAYCEDTDLGLRIRLAGWQAAVAGRARVTHYYSMTTGRASLAKLFWVERNHFWVAAKNWPWFFLPLVPVVTLWRFAVQAYIICTDSGELREFVHEAGFTAVVLTVVRAHLSAVAGLPKMIRKRLAFRPKRKLGSVEMARLILRFRMPLYEILGGRRNARK